MTFSLRAIVTCFALLALAAAWVYGKDIPIQDQLKVYSSLRSVATVIFGVMGAWIAIVYQKSLKEIFSKQPKEESVSSKLKKIFFPMRVATVIVLATLALDWLTPILYQIEALVENYMIVRQASFMTLTILVLFLFWSLLLTLIPLEDAEHEVEVLDKHLDNASKKTSRTSKRKKDS